MDNKQHNLSLRRRTCTQKCREKRHFLQHKIKHQKEKEVYTDGSKNPGKKVGLAAVFEDATRRGALPKEASIHTAEMTAIKVALKEIKGRREDSWVSELNAGNRIKQGKSSNTKPNI